MAGGDRSGRILVTGATGTQGGATARALIEAGFSVRALTRDPAKPTAEELRRLGAEVVGGDLDDRHSVEKALEGVGGVFAMQQFWETGYDREIEQGTRLADAAKSAGVHHFVYSSVGSAHRNTGLSHFESKWKIENHIREIGLPHTIFRPVWFMSNWEGPYFRPYILNGTLATPLSPTKRFQQVDVTDLGRFVVLALSDPEAWLGRSVDLAGDDQTVAEVAETFARVVGRPVHYHQIPWDEYRKMAGDEYHDMFRWFEDVGYDVDVEERRRDVAELIDLETYLRRSGWAGAEAPALEG